MKLEELLKTQGLSDEQISGILKGMRDNKIYTTSLENADERYQKLKGQKDDIEGQLNAANTTIEDLKKNNKDNETLQKKINDHEVTIEALKADGVKKEFDMALELELVKVKSKNPKALRAILDLNKIKRNEDGSFTGLKEQLEERKKTDPYLFETGKIETKYTPTGGIEPDNGDISSLMKSKDFNLTEHLKSQMKQ